MQQIGSIARAVLADIKRAKEARDKLRLAGGLLGPAKILDRPLSPDENAAGERLEGSGSLNRQPQHFTAEGVGGSDPATQKTAMGSGLEKIGHAAEERKSTSNGCACPNSDEAIRSTDRAKDTLRGLG